MRISSKPVTIDLGSERVRLRRTTDGVMEVCADDYVQVAAGMGFAHAADRLVQMVIHRLAGQGRVSECLKAGADQLRIDMFARLMGFQEAAQEEWSTCDPDTKRWVEAYCRGVNHYLRHHSLPLELHFLRHRPPSWTPTDTLLVSKLITYFMGHSQRQIEKFIVQAIQAGARIDQLRRLFRPHLDELNDEQIRLIRQVNVWEPPIPTNGFLNSIAHLSASNNWAVAPQRSATGNALECHDPHLPCGQLPQTWYEFVTRAGGRFGIGVSIPGLPGLLMGRNNDISLGFTYGYMDVIDFFVERCQSGKYWSSQGWRDFRVRCETIEQRDHRPVNITLYDTEHGVLDFDPYAPEPPSGLHLSCSWSGRSQGAVALLRTLRQLPDLESVMAAQEVLRHAAISANWVIADRRGNIGYQQSGLLPARSHSGLYPLAGWDPSSAWQGLVDADRLASALNPPEGFLVTANDDHQSPEGPCPVNLCMGSDRADRARELLSQSDQLTIDDMKRFQADLYSRHAKRWMEALLPLLPHDLAGSQTLRDWDCCYDAASRGATLFELVYAAILREVCGRRLFGEVTWDTLVHETPLMGTYFQYFDRSVLLFDPGEANPGNRVDAELIESLRAVLRRVLTQHPPESVPLWGQQQQVDLRNVLVPKRIPWIDPGRVSFEGSRGTLKQANLVRAYGQSIVIAPSYKYVADLGTAAAETAIAGGPSGRPWSRLYRIGWRDWLRQHYKLLTAC